MHLALFTVLMGGTHVTAGRKPEQTTEKLSNANSISTDTSGDALDCQQQPSRYRI